ncbi:Proteasome subunit beta type-7 [Plecturocebus cupreus]
MAGPVARGQCDSGESRPKLTPRPLTEAVFAGKRDSRADGTLDASAARYGPALQHLILLFALRNAVLEADFAKKGYKLPKARKTGTTIAGVMYKLLRRWDSCRHRHDNPAHFFQLGAPLPLHWPSSQSCDSQSDAEADAFQHSNSHVKKLYQRREIQDGRLATAQECSSQRKRREREDAALSDEFLLPTDREIPGRGATRVASVTLLAGVAVLPVPQRGASRCGVYGTDGLGWSHPHKENSN